MKLTTEKTFTITLNETEAARISEALYVAIGVKAQWEASNFDIDLCESIINEINKNL